MCVWRRPSYFLRVTDDGRLLGTERKVMDVTVETLQRMCSKVDAQIVRLDRFPVTDGDGEREVVEAHIKSGAHHQKRRSSSCSLNASQPVTEELRVIFLGDANVGKSTLLGILAYGGLDNGAGSVRMGLLRHRHEILSGHTTSVSVEPLVFMEQDSGGGLVPVRPEEFESTEYLTLTLQRRYMDAPKVIQFFDMPGKPRFNRSVLSSLTSMAGPDLVCIVVACGEESTAESRFQCIEEYLSVLEPLKIRVLVAISKTDLVSSDELAVIDHGIRERFGLPTFSVSALNGIGVENLVYVLLESSPMAFPLPSFCEEPCDNLFLVESIKELEDVGTVLKGTVMRGALERLTSEESSPAWFVGPDENGAFNPIKLKTIHRLRIPAQRVDARLMASVAVEAETGSVKRGMFMINGCQPTAQTMHKGFRVGDCPGFLKDLDKPVKGLLVLNGVRWPVVLTVAQKNNEVQVDLEDSQRVFLLSGMKYLISTHLGILAGLIK